jgi:hypothetical protein
MERRRGLKERGRKWRVGAGKTEQVFFLNREVID